MRISRPGRRTLVLLAVFAGLSVAALASHALWLTWLGRYLVLEQQPFPADIVIVLGGDYRGTRILKGAELAWQGFAPTVLVSGGGEMYGQHESDLAVAWAVAHGYRENLFVRFKYPALSTRDEVHAVVGELRHRHLHRFILVTSTFHTKRASAICREEAPEMSFRVVSSPDRYFTPDGWWKNREGEKTFALEWTKTVTSWFGV